MKKIILLTMISSIFYLSCSESDKSNERDYLSGGIESVKKGIEGVWKTTRYHTDGSSSIFYLHYKDSKRWYSTAIDGILQDGIQYNIAQKTEGFMLELDHKKYILTINKLTETEMVLTSSEGEVSTQYRIK